MKIAGIIAEYNPFHEGHRYHIEKTREMSGADYVVVVMSGDFVQRGEPAIVDKYLRAGMALDGGADLVIEMPALYATASAEYFATAGVGILDRLGCVDYLSFGSEWAGEKELAGLADILLEEPVLYREVLKKKLEEGYNYPQAREAAVIACFPEEKYAHILDEPNHILGIEYIKSIRRRNSDMKPVILIRKGSYYHSQEWDCAREVYPSATALRSLIRKKDWDSLRTGAPLAADLIRSLSEKDELVSWDDLMPYLDYMCLMKSKVLGKYFGMDYDISRRIAKIHQPGKSLEEAVAACHSRNYTDAAIRRIFLHLVLQMKDYPFLSEAPKIPLSYARVLGFRKEAGPLMRQIRENSSIPIIQKTTDGRKLRDNDMIGEAVYNMDIRCADFYEQIAAVKAGRKARVEWIRNPVFR